jgi:hypothetical protein
LLVGEDHPQLFVPGDEVVHRRGEGGHVQRAAQPPRGGHQVLRAARFEPVEEVEPLLGGRQRGAVARRGPAGDAGLGRRAAQALGQQALRGGRKVRPR